MGTKVRWRPGRAFTKTSPALYLSAGMVALAVLTPAAYLVVRAASGGAEHVARTLWDRGLLWLTVRSGSLSLAVTISALLIGVPLAWLTSRTNLPARRLWIVLTALPLVIPSYIGGYAFIAALGPRGALQRLLEPLGVDRLPEIYGFFGAWLVLSLFTYPYVFLTVTAAIRGIDTSSLEAASMLTDSRREIFYRIVLPQLRPAMAAGGLLVMLYTLHDFGAVSLMRYDTFTRAIYLRYSASFDRAGAATLSLVLVGLTLAVLIAEARSRGKASYHPVHSGTIRQPKEVPLGKLRWPAFGFCFLLTLLALGVPTSVVGYWLSRSFDAPDSLSITLVATWNSLSGSFLGAALAVAAAIPVALIAVRRAGPIALAIEKVSFIGYALPGVVVALSLVFLGARVAPVVYQTRAMLAFAYAVLFLPQAAGSIRNSLMQINPRLEEAARTLGNRWFGAIRRAVMPLAAPGIMAGGALVFLTAMKELPATLLLAPIGFTTLATQVWSATSAASFVRAAAPALALILLSSVPLGFLILRETKST